MTRPLQPSSSSAHSTEDAEGYIPALFPVASQIGNRPWTRLWWRWDVRTGKRLSNIRWLVLRAGRVLWSELLWRPSTHEILREIGSLGWRIGRICQARISVRYGSLQGNYLDRRGNRRTRACIRDTQDIKKFRPRATLLDRQLFVEGWQQGAEWALCEIGNSQVGNSRSNQAAWDDPLRDGNPTPPSATQQPA